MAAETNNPDDETLADLADAILDIARRLAPRGHDLREIVPLTGTEVSVIREITRSTLISPTQLAAATGLKRSNVSTAIRSLEGRGLLERRHPAGNDRSIELVITPQAAENFHRVRMIWADRLRGVSPDVLVEAMKALDTLTAVAEGLTEATRAGSSARATPTH